MEEVLGNIRVVLVGTLYHGNVGAVCRAMANMGLSRLVLAEPLLCDDPAQVNRMAVHAGSIWQRHERVDSMAEAVAECSVVIGTTVRGGLYRQHVKTPRELAPYILQQAVKAPVALVFGREDKGLSNDEIALATHLIKIPVHSGYASLNLAQAVLLCCYEIFQATGCYEPPEEKSLPATSQSRQRLQQLWRAMLLEVGYMDEEKANHMMQGFQRIFSRGLYSEDDVAMMMGVARQAQWASLQRRGTQPSD